jgi:hypothetical protein
VLDSNHCHGVELEAFALVDGHHAHGPLLGEPVQGFDRILAVAREFGDTCDGV